MQELYNHIDALQELKTATLKREDEERLWKNSGRLITIQPWKAMRSQQGTCERCCLFSISNRWLLGRKVKKWKRMMWQ